MGERWELQRRNRHRGLECYVHLDSVFMLKDNLGWKASKRGGARIIDKSGK